MQRLFRYGMFALALAALLAPAIASAHGHTTVGNYELVIGFHNEPAYQGEPNGLDLFVTDKTTNKRVNDLADKLKAEIIRGSSKKELKVEAQYGQEGAYTAYILPSEAGDYTWHIFGDIKGTPVDVSMSSSPDTFSSVAPKSAVAFPAAEPTAAQLQQSTQRAMLIGSAGVVLGLLGTAFGLLGLRARRTARGSIGEAQRAG